jgi:hypothetical protein
MRSLLRNEFLISIQNEFGQLQRIGKSTSLFSIQERARLYVRYSKPHDHGSTFFGLRQEDLGLLEGFPSFIAFLWDGQREPLLVRYEQFAPIFHSVEPASDGQYKVHVYSNEEGTDLHIVRAGRFGVDSYFGLNELRSAVSGGQDFSRTTEFSHHQIQSVVGAIGKLTGHAVYVPPNDRSSLDWDIVERFELVKDIPSTGRHAPAASLSLIDVLWIHPTQNLLEAAFEVEHSTPIYSGLLRFNDVHIDFKLPRAGIIAQAERKDAFLHQINRRTFQASGLDQVCLFYNYSEIYRWYQRLVSKGQSSVTVSPDSSQKKPAV